MRYSLFWINPIPPWRGIVNGIVENTAELLEKNSVDLREIIILIGPGICHHHFEIGPEIATLFKERVELNNGQIFANLKLETKGRLLDRGFSLENIYIDPGCTFCSSKRYFSYRRDKPRELETMLCVLTLD